MAHNHPNYPHFTINIVQKGLLLEPFRLVDIGVAGGIHSHWLCFGNKIEVWGFDALYDHGVGPLIDANKQPDRFRYYHLGIGKDDKISRFIYLPDNPSSSFFLDKNIKAEPAADAYQIESQLMTMRSLDSLMKEGILTSVDFMKMDASSSEPEIIKGAVEFLQNSGIFGIESEVNFIRNEQYPRSHFVELYDELASSGFTVYDIGVQRNSRVTLPRGLPRKRSDGKYKLDNVGKLWVADVLFLSPIFESVELQSSLSSDKLLKLIAIAELYGLNDIALDILLKNKNRLSHTLDVRVASDWLIRDDAKDLLTYERYMRDLVGKEIN